MFVAMAITSKLIVWLIDWLIEWLNYISPRVIKRIAMKKIRDIQSFFFFKKEKSQSQPQLQPGQVKSAASEQQ